MSCTLNDERFASASLIDRSCNAAAMQTASEVVSGRIVQTAVSNGCADRYIAAIAALCWPPDPPGARENDVSLATGLTAEWRDRTALVT